MASLTTRSNGSKFVTITDATKARRTITLGKMADRESRRITDKIDDLEAARRTGIEPPAEVLAWLARIDDDLHSKLVVVGLVDAREPLEVVTVRRLVQTYVAERSDWKDGTRVAFDQMTRFLLQYFSPDKDIATVTAADAEGFRRFLAPPKLSVATGNRHVKRAKQLFTFAKKKRWLTVSPFQDVKGGEVGGNLKRRYFVSREETEAILNAAPDAEWRLLIALSRYAGLRVPSEALKLRWSDVNWHQNRILISVPKLEHIPGRETRTIPIFPELRPYLETVWDVAEEGAEFVITRYRGKYHNLNTQLQRIIKRAGLKPWPRIWHAMRASRQTELVRDFPLHVVCSWIGNSAEIANEHYLTVTEDDFDKATVMTTHIAVGAQRQAQRAGVELGSIPSQPEMQNASFSGENEALRFVATMKTDPSGIATPIGNHGENLDSLVERSARRSALAGRLGTDLAELVELWPRLTQDDQQAVLEHVRSLVTGRGGVESE